MVGFCKPCCWFFRVETSIWLADAPNDGPIRILVLRLGGT
jgi:hypothetical protein